MKIIYFNNDFYEEDKCLIFSNDRGFLLGDGLFETLKIYKGSAIFLKQHWNRFISAAKFLEIPLEISFEKLQNVIYELLDKNNLTEKDASIRITLTRGPSERGIHFPDKMNPTFLITVFPYIASVKKMLSATLSTIPKNEHTPLSKIKSLNYLDNILARREAEKAGFDEAILLNTSGNVVEATTANLFFVLEGILYTPRIKDGALPGVTREIILNLANKEGLTIKEQTFNFEKLLSADEIFLTNSLWGIRPVGQINNAWIRQNPGLFTLRLEKAFANITSSIENRSSES